MPEVLVKDPSKITLSDIMAITNNDVRNKVLNRIDFAKLLLNSPNKVQTEDFCVSPNGTLESLLTVKSENNQPIIAIDEWQMSFRATAYMQILIAVDPAKKPDEFNFVIMTVNKKFTKVSEAQKYLHSSEIVFRGLDMPESLDMPAYPVHRT